MLLLSNVDETPVSAETQSLNFWPHCLLLDLDLLILTDKCFSPVFMISRSKNQHQGGGQRDKLIPSHADRFLPGRIDSQPRASFHQGAANVFVLKRKH